MFGMPVVLGQPLVDERVVGVQQFDDAAIFADDGVEEQLHFAPHRLPQRVVEVGINQRQRTGALQAAQVQPLAREILRERFSPRVLQHAADLPLEHHRILEPALARERDELIVGAGAPQEERQAGRQVQVGDLVRRVQLRVGRLGFDAVDELGRRQHAGQHHLDALVEAAVFAAVGVELHQQIDVSRRRRPAIGASDEPR